MPDLLQSFVKVGYGHNVLQKVTLGCDFTKCYPIYFKCHVIINAFATYCNTMNHNEYICIIGSITRAQL